VAGHEATSAFAGDPQPVEVYHRGIWYLGELLGWRHESDGRCTARVRCVVDGLRHSAWKDLGDLRLPQPIALEPPPDDEPDSDETRPHVLLADLRSRPRPPAHAVVPPPRWTPPAEPSVPNEQAERPGSSQAVAAGVDPSGSEVDVRPVPTAQHDTADWAHLRRGGRLSRV
jgi:hypothetical protein